MTAKAAWKPMVKRLTTVTGAVAWGGSRVYPSVLPQNPTLPAYVYQQISGVREHAMGVDTGDVHARVQLDVYATSYLDTAEGGKHARDALSRWSGTATGTVVQTIFVENEIDGHEEQLEEADRTVWRRTLDFMVHYEES